MTDEELVDLAQQGHREALETLLARWVPRLMAFFRGCGHDVHDASDRTQETLLGYEGYLRGFQDHGDGSFARYMYRCARNLDTAEHRKRTAQKRGDGVAPAPLPDGPSHPTSEDRALLRLECGEDLERAWEVLSLQDREILLMRFYEDYGPAEIGEKLGMRPNVVSQRICRAIGRMRAMVADSVGNVESASQG